MCYLSLGSWDVNDVTLKFVWGTVHKTEVRSILIVKVDIVLQVLAQVFEGFDVAMSEVLVFDGSVCPLHQSVVIAGVSHADSDAGLLEFLSVLDAPVL